MSNRGGFSVAVKVVDYFCILINFSERKCVGIKKQIDLATIEQIFFIRAIVAILSTYLRSNIKYYEIKKPIIKKNARGYYDDACGFNFVIRKSDG